jgi:hypothetical protein
MMQQAISNLLESLLKCLPKDWKHNIQVQGNDTLNDILAGSQSIVAQMRAEESEDDSEDPEDVTLEESGQLDEQLDADVEDLDEASYEDSDVGSDDN